jgi:hypothetical protein
VSIVPERIVQSWAELCTEQRQHPAKLNDIEQQMTATVHQSRRRVSKTAQISQTMTECGLAYGLVIDLEGLAWLENRDVLGTALDTRVDSHFASFFLIRITARRFPAGRILPDRADNNLHRL